MRQASLPRISVTSVPPVALLAPRVAVVVVAERFPEAWLVVVQQPQAPDPFGALPEVEVWHEQARRSAVLGLERLAAVGVGYPGPSPRDVLQRQIRGVAAVAEGEHVLGGGLDPFEQGVH